MEGNLALRANDDITLHLDHKVHGQHRPVTVFLSCGDGRIGIGINIISPAHHDDVNVEIEDGRIVTIQVKPVHAFLRQFCISGPPPEKESATTAAVKNLANMALLLATKNNGEKVDVVTAQGLLTAFKDLVKEIKQTELCENVSTKIGEDFIARIEKVIYGD